MIKNNLNLLLSSSNFPIFFVQQFLSFDLIERNSSSVNGFYKFYCDIIKFNRPFLNVKFELKLPFSNDLGKFRNRVLILLYNFIFELLVGVRPTIKPLILSPMVNEKDKLFKKHQIKSLLLLSRSGTIIHSIEKFIFYKDLTLIQSSNFLFLISCFISRHTYLSYTVPSRLLKMNRLAGSYQFKLNPGLGILDPFSQFDEFILSRVQLSFSFSGNFYSKLTDLLLSSFGLNLSHLNSNITILSFPFLNLKKSSNFFKKIIGRSVLIPFPVTK